MFKNIISPVQAWLLSIGKCVGCGMPLSKGKKEAVNIAEHLRELIMNKPITMRREKFSVTVSIGVASFPADAKLREDIIMQADKRLYDAKAKGKNKVCSK